MTSLETKLNAILNDKLTNLKPENLKKGITCLGVTGTLEASASSEGVKLFSTIEEMQADTTAKEGDLAVVYRSEIQNIKDGDVITSMTFPKTVVFDTAITTNYRSRLRNSTEPLISLDMELSGTRFRVMNMYGAPIQLILYSSSDGITYTRVDANADTYEIGETTISGVDEHICKFIQVGGMYFEGLYQSEPIESGYKINYIKDMHWENGKIAYSISEEPYDFTKLIQVIREKAPDKQVNVFIVGNVAYLQWTASRYGFYEDDGTFRLNVGLNTTDVTKYVSSIDMTTWEVTEDLALTADANCYALFQNSSGLVNDYYSDLRFNKVDMFIRIRVDDNTVTNMTPVGLFSFKKGALPTEVTVETSMEKVYTYKYLLAPTQLTTVVDDVYKSIFYSKNGVEIGTLTANVSNSFADTNAEVYAMIKQAYDNMEPKILTDTDKTIDKNMYFIPVNAQGKPLLDTSSVTDMTYMFQDCTNLTTIPQLNTSNVTTMNNTFYNCQNLTTIPLLDTSNVTTTYSMFSYCANLTTIPLLDTSKTTDTSRMFYNCLNLTAVPLLDTSNVTTMRYMFYHCTSLTTIPLLDTSNVTNMQYMFQNCTNLTTIPLLDTSNVTNMQYMFNGCTSLSDESLSNILAMCTHAIAYIAQGTNMTLNYIGLTSEQATKCTTLSNYQAFLDAGWTTGY